MKSKNLLALCEGAIFVALSVGLSFVKISIGLAYGGSIDLSMVPLVVYAVRWGLLRGLGAGLVSGTLMFFFDGGVAVNWQSMLLDFSVAFAFVGFAGLMRGRRPGLPVGALIGCLGRFLIHFISGITIYAEYMPSEFMGLTMNNVWLYSMLYNGAYMLPSTVITVAVCAAIMLPLRRWMLPGGNARTA